MDVRAIQAQLPHRYPFLLIDRIVEETADKIVARKNVTANEPFFAGHFPGYPVMPGVLIVEAMAQAGGILAGKATGFDPNKSVMLFMGIDKARFRRAVVPGDTLMIEVVPLRRGPKIWKLRGEAKVDGQVVAEADLLATLVDRAAS